MALLLNSRQLDVEGGPVPVRREDVRRAWTGLKNEVPHRFATSTEAVRNWHFEEFQIASQARAWPSALEHLDALLAAAPGSWSLHWHRANTCTNLLRWADALKDYAQVIELDTANEDVVRVREDIFGRGLGNGAPDPTRAPPGSSAPGDSSPSNP